MAIPVIISNWEWGKLSIVSGHRVLSEGGSALDAVEAGILSVEDDPSADTVGTGGLPNLEGVAELDASIMVGNTMQAGGVSCLTLTKNPISVARKVMEQSPHTILCGRGAQVFARALGFAEYDPVTPAARAKWSDLRRKLFASLRNRSLLDEYSRAAGSNMDLASLAHGVELLLEAGVISDAGTVGTLCMDKQGTIVAGTSTSGWPLRLPGRVSDSSVIGAGTYANAHGASSCTGPGEFAIKHCLARKVCDYLAEGYDPRDACTESLRQMVGAEKVPYLLGLIALDAEGRVGGACTKQRKTVPFSYQYQRLTDSEMTVVVPSPITM